MHIKLIWFVELILLHKFLTFRPSLKKFHSNSLTILNAKRKTNIKFNRQKISSDSQTSTNENTIDTKDILVVLQ
jgi:hypothetical protein